MSHHLYFSLLPSDLLPPLFLYFDSAELLLILPEIKLISDFNRLFDSRIFWLKLWRRDVSSFLASPENPYEKYVEIFSKLSKFNNEYDKIKYLAENGYDVLLLPLLSDIDDYQYTMRQAARGGHMEIVNLMLQRGATNYSETMANAAAEGHIDIVKLMLDKGAKEYNWAMVAATSGNHIDIVRLMLERGANDYNTVMALASSRGYTGIVNLMLERGATNYVDPMRLVAPGGRINLVKKMHK